MESSPQPNGRPPVLPHHTPVVDEEAFLRFWGKERDQNAVAIIREARRHFGKWNNERVCRLCRCANCTPQELFVILFGFKSRKKIRNCFVFDRWPLEYVIHMARFESYLLQRKFGYVETPDPLELAMARLAIRAINQPA